ncbi:MAG: HAD family hydrolase [Clostridiales bacterium]|nr:HAD family hydrolase [Clostridiales bacterium]
MNTVLFDLDGTLLPMEQTAFLRRYLGLLGAKAAAHGLEPQTMIDALWRGTSAMANNDGAMSNRQRFWDSFTAELGQDVRALEPVFNDFYGNEFDAVRDIIKPNPWAREVVDLLQIKGYTLALATNPLFPPVAIDTRLKWVDLKRDDFAYISDYENSRYCKPHPEYFRAVLQEVGKCPQDALMVGNSLRDDMPARDLGLMVYLITDFMEGEGEGEIALLPHGSFAEFAAYVRQLPYINKDTETGR